MRPALVGARPRAAARHAARRRGAWRRDGGRGDLGPHPSTLSGPPKGWSPQSSCQGRWASCPHRSPCSWRRLPTYRQRLCGDRSMPKALLRRRAVQWSLSPRPGRRRLPQAGRAPRRSTPLRPRGQGSSALLVWTWRSPVGVGLSTRWAQLVSPKADGLDQEVEPAKICRVPFADAKQLLLSGVVSHVVPCVLVDLVWCFTTLWCLVTVLAGGSRCSTVIVSVVVVLGGRGRRRHVRLSEGGRGPAVRRRRSRRRGCEQPYSSSLFFNRSGMGRSDPDALPGWLKHQPIAGPTHVGAPTML